MALPKTEDKFLIVTDERFEDHMTGSHPESPLRIKTIREQVLPVVSDPVLSADEILQRARLKPEAIDQVLRSVHSPDYLKSLDQFAAHGGGNWDADTVVSGDSYDVAHLAAGTAIAGVDLIMRGETERLFCGLRPPGHHALADRAMGFCLMNNVVAAAKRAVREHELRRVLIVDWDVHHGNGTQALVEEDEQIWYFSVHRHPFYPGTGMEDETGRGKGLGTIRNLPLQFGISRPDYIKTVTHSLQEFAGKCQPELVLVSAGFDAHREDPIGSLGLETEDFQTLTRLVREIAESHSGGRILSLLEGGYNLEALAESVTVHCQAMS